MKMHLISILLLFILLPKLSFTQAISKSGTQFISSDRYVKSVNNLSLEAAFELTNRVAYAAQVLHKKVAIAILDRSGNILLMVRDDEVGPHNMEAARRKAYTALSTKMSTLSLLRNVDLNGDTKNLNSLPELLLLSGGVPIYFGGNIIGSIGIAGGGSPENDDAIAKAAVIPESGITTVQ